MKIRHKLTASFFLVVLVPMVAMIFMTQSKMEAAITKDYEKKGKGDTQRVVEYVLPKLQEATLNYVKFLAMDANVVHASYYANVVDSPDDLKKRLNVSVQELGLSYIEVADKKGKITYSTIEERNGRNINDYEVVKNALSDKNRAYLERHPEFDQYVLHSAAKIIRKGKMIGVLHGGYIIDEAILGKTVGDLATLFSQDGEAVTSTGAPPQDVAFINELFSHIDSACRADKHGEQCAKNEFSFSHETIDGVPYLMVAAPIRGLDNVPVGTLVISQSAQELEQQLAEARNAVITLGVLFIAIACGVGMFATQGIIKPIDRLTATAHDIAEGEGDLTQRIDVKSNDEIGELAAKFNTFIGKIQTLVREIGATSAPLNDASMELSSAATTTGENVYQQRGKIDTVAASMNQMAAASQEAARNAETATSSSSKAEEHANQGAAVVAESISATEALAREVEEAADVINKLERDSENVSGVLDVIKGVAEQTNLLALNAAIEAARAGDQGRGFAVVADEVRTLAQRTQDSTTEIHDIIESLQSGAEAAVKVMERGKEKAYLSVEKAKVANESFRDIVSAVVSVGDKMREIASAAEQQSIVAEDINQHIHDISQLSERTAETAQNTTMTSDKLAHLSEELAAQVGRFKV